MNKLMTVVLFSVFLFLSGCCGFSEAIRGFAGVSTKILEDTRKDAVTKDFNIDLDSTRSIIKAALKDGKSYIYREDHSCNLIAVYVSQTDTTPVGIFLTVLDKDNTRVEVSSPSTYGKEVISKIIFNALKGSPDVKKQ